MPAARLLVVQAAVRVLPLPVRARLVQPVRAEPPSARLTLPVGLLPVTVAVRVTGVPTVDGLSELDSVVVDAGSDTSARRAAAASTMPAPQSAVVQSRTVPVGNARAVVWIVASTCAGVSDGASDRISEAMPVTCGVAMLVPW